MGKYSHFLSSVNFVNKTTSSLIIMSDSTSQELACVYASLILHDDDVAITAEKMSTIMKAAKVPFDSYWPTLFAKALEGRSIGDLICNVGAGGGAPVAVGGGGGGSAAQADEPEAEKEEEKKKEESEEDSDDDMGFGLFD